jgi:DNA polymerase
MKFVFTDTETASVVNLTERGLANYAADSSTHLLLWAYAVGEGDVQVIEAKDENGIQLEDIPEDFRALLDDPTVTLIAWNCSFERAIFKHVLGIDLPIQRFIDPMVYVARSCALPGSLEMCGKALGLGEDEAKLKDGKRLIRLFCEPCTMGGVPTLFGVTEPYFRFKDRHAEEWSLFVEYVKRDVTSMRTILRKMWPFRMPQSEVEAWWLDQKINERGLPVDMPMVESAIKLTERAKAELGEQFKQLTGLANPNSTTQLLPWVQANGYPFNSLGKRWVNASLSDSTINEKCRQAFTLRQQLAKTSVEKFSTMKALTTAEGLLKNQFVFMGASSTGRWAGAGVQPQNFPRPSKAVEQEMDLAVNLVRNGDYDGLELMFGSVLDSVAGTVRGAIRAPEGKLLVVADLSAIENRVLGFEAQCEGILDVFRTGKDPYKAFGVHLFGVPYDQITKEQRQLAKAPVLGCGYMLGGGEEEQDANGDTIRTGLWGYAKNVLGVEMTQEQAHKSVQIFRSAYPEVVKLWYDLIKAATTAIRNAKQAEAGKCTFYVKNEMLCVRLPSGRDLHYMKPTIRKGDKYENIFYQRFSPQTGLAFEAQYSPNRATENCLSGDTPTITDRGVVPLRDVSLSDRLWDGEEWVSHKGLISRGVQETISWLSLRGTKDHLILAGNRWLRLEEAEKQRHSVLKSGLDSARRLLSHLVGEEGARQLFNAIAEKSTKSPQKKLCEGASNGAQTALPLKSAISAEQGWTSSQTRNLGACGFTEGRESFLDASTKRTKRTRATEEEEFSCISRGSRVSELGLNLPSPSKIGTSWIPTWIESTITGTTNQEISELCRELLTRTTGEAQSSLISTESKSRIWILLGATRLIGQLTRFFGIWNTEKQQRRQSSSTTRQEVVYDVLESGPRNRLAVMCDEGMVIVHNCTQAIARDILVNGMKLADAAGLEIVGSVHDELICVTDEARAEQALETLRTSMSTSPEFCKDLPLSAEGFVSKMYRK